MIGNLINQIVLMLLLMLVGFFANKSRILHDQAASDLTELLLIIIGPALIIKSLQQKMTASALHQLGLLAFGITLLYLIGILLSHLLFAKVNDKDEKRSAIFASIYSNVGFIGLPLADALFGQAGVFYVVIAIAIYNIFCWTHGVTLFRENGSCGDRLRHILTNPNVIAIIIGLILFFTNTQLPSLLNQGLTYLGNANTPLSMIIIGNSLAKISFDKQLFTKSVFLTLLLRNLIYPLIGLVIFLLLGFSDKQLLMALLAVACPVGSMAALFSIQANGKSDYAVIAMGLSTVLSLLTIPMLFSLAQLM